MKKSIMAIAIMFMGTTVFSQSIDLGVKGGANFTNIMSLEGLSLEGKTEFHAGIFAAARFSEKIGIQADVLYSQQGAKFNSGNFDLTYVNIPVVFKYYLVEGQGLNIQIGPQFGFLVDDNISQNGFLHIIHIVHSPFSSTVPFSRNVFSAKHLFTCRKYCVILGCV